MFVLIWTMGIYQIWAQAERTEFKYKKLVIISISYAIISTLSSLFFVYNLKNKVNARILGTVLSALILYMGLFLGQIKKERSMYNREIWKHTLTLAVPLLPHYLSQIILNSSDRIMISKLVGENQAGIYSLAYTLAQMMTMFNSAMLSTLEPWIYKNIKEAEEKKIMKIEKIAYISFSIIACVNVLLIAFAPEVLKLFAPEEYGDAIWVIPSISISVYFMFMYSFFALFEFYFEKTKYIATATLTGTILNVLLNLIFIKAFGYIAAGYTTLICYIVYAFMHYYFAKKVVKEKLDDIRIYDMRIIILLSSVFIAFSFVLMLTYRVIVLRYTLVVILVIYALIKKKDIKGKIYQIINLREQ